MTADPDTRRSFDRVLDGVFTLGGLNRALASVPPALVEQYRHTTAGGMDPHLAGAIVRAEEHAYRLRRARERALVQGPIGIWTRPRSGSASE